MNTEILKDNYIINSCEVKELVKLNFTCPGVYILHDSDELNVIRYSNANNLYVGKSKNIYHRVKTHTVKLPYVTFIGFLNNPSQGLIDATEDVLIKVFKSWCIKNNKTLLNTEQTKEDINTLLLHDECNLLTEAVKDVLKHKISLDKNELNSILSKHKPKMSLKMSSLLNMQVLKGYTYNNENMYGYVNLNCNEIDFTDFKNLVDIDYEENYVDYIKFKDYFVFLTDEDMLYIKRNKIELQKNVKYLHIGKGYAINGSSIYDIKYLDYKKWKKQDFDYIDLVGDGFEDFEQIAKLDNCPISYEDYMQL